MNASSFPDWNKVGRRIGKRLRDVLKPPQNDGPSKAEREAQRLRDQRKGFAYFDTFDEVLRWSSEDVFARQQANTPLLVRPATAVHDQKSPSTKLILCHDYKGGYRDYESVRPEPLTYTSADLVPVRKAGCVHISQLQQGSRLAKTFEC